MARAVGVSDASVAPSRSECSIAPGDQVDDVGGFGVVPNAGGVDGPDFTGDADALHPSVLGPGSHSQFCGDGPSEVSPVVGIAAHGEGAELLGVDQPQAAVAVGAHGDEQRERRGLFGSLMVSKVCRCQAPLGARTGPRCWQLGDGFGQVERDAVVVELDGGELRHRVPVEAHLRSERLEGDVEMLNEVVGADGRGEVDAAFDGDQVRLDGGGSPTRPTVAELVSATATKRPPERSREDHARAGDPEQHPDREDVLVAVLDIGGVGGWLSAVGRRGNRGS